MSVWLTRTRMKMQIRTRINHHPRRSTVRHVDHSRRDARPGLANGDGVKRTFSHRKCHLHHRFAWRTKLRWSTDYRARAASPDTIFEIERRGGVERANDALRSDERFGRQRTDRPTDEDVSSPEPLAQCSTLHCVCSCLWALVVGCWYYAVLMSILMLRGYT